MIPLRTVVSLGFPHIQYGQQVQQRPATNKGTPMIIMIKNPSTFDLGQGDLGSECESDDFGNWKERKI